MNIVYTALFNQYDQLHDIKLEPGWRAICFTNHFSLESDTWELVKMEDRFRSYREVKIKPHQFLPPGWDKCLWLDANLEPSKSLDSFVNNRNGFWLMVHPDRVCIYAEAKSCREMGKDNHDLINAQMRRYIMMGYPRDNGLSATGIIVRSNTEENRLFGEEWWSEVEGGSVRDQLSFNYVAHKRKLSFGMFPFLHGVNYHYHVAKLKEFEERRALKGMTKTRRTAEFYKLYGDQNGTNSKTY